MLHCLTSLEHYRRACLLEGMISSLCLFIPMLVIHLVLTETVPLINLFSPFVAGEFHHSILPASR